MPNTVPCTRCGNPIEVPEGLDLPPGLSLTHAEGECPKAMLRHYRVRITVDRFEHEPEENEEGERMVMAGSTLACPSFMEAFPLLTKEVSAKWERIMESAALVEADEIDPEDFKSPGSDGPDGT